MISMNRKNRSVKNNRIGVKRVMAKIVMLKKVFSNALIAIANTITNVWETKPPIGNNVRIILALV